LNVPHRIVVACLGLVLAVASARAEDEASLVRVSYGEGWDALPALIAIERGFFHDEGLVASGMAVTSAEAVIQSLVAGSSDFAVVPQRTLMVMAAADVPIKVVALSGWNTRTELVVRKDLGEIDSVAALKGRTIAVARGAQAHPVLIRLLNAEGLAPSDVKIEMLAPRDLASALERSAADAIFASGHYTTRVVGEGAGRVLVSHEALVEKIGYVGALPLVTSNQIVEERPDFARRVLRAWLGALRHIQTNREDAAKVLQIFFHRQGVPVGDEQSQAWVGMTRWDRYVWTDSDVADAEYNAWGLKVGGILKLQPSLGAFMEPRFAQEASAALRAPDAATGDQP
jgi:ABC-type nitrate/sulfonate/bicarbonate transport system substrate-binding protein